MYVEDALTGVFSELGNLRAPATPTKTESIPTLNFQVSLMLPDPFTTEDGDAILRVAPDDIFRVHKIVLSLASPVFKDLFQTAQPDQPDRGQNGLPTIPITDPPESVDLLLRFIYPGVVPPIITDPIKLSALLTIADKYGVQMILPIVEERLDDEVVLEEDPFGVYIVARRWGFTDVAKSAARRLTLHKVMASPSSKDPQSFTGDDFFRLVWFMQRRGENGKLMIRGEVLGYETYNHSLEEVEFFNQLIERILGEFEVDPWFDTERMVKVFVDGPSPPQLEDAYGDEWSQRTESRITKTLCNLASRLDHDCWECLEKAMDGEFPA